MWTCLVDHAFKISVLLPAVCDTLRFFCFFARINDLQPQLPVDCGQHTPRNATTPHRGLRGAYINGRPVQEPQSVGCRGSESRALRHHVRVPGWVQEKPFFVSCLDLDGFFGENRRLRWSTSILQQRLSTSAPTANRIELPVRLCLCQCCHLVGLNCNSQVLAIAASLAGHLELWFDGGYLDACLDQLCEPSTRVRHGRAPR